RLEGGRRPCRPLARGARQAGAQGEHQGALVDEQEPAGEGAREGLMPTLEQRLGKERTTLYAGPLGGFTAARTTRAKELRGAGERELADAVAKLPKPTVAAWAVDQVAQHYTRELASFL